MYLLLSWLYLFIADLFPIIYYLFIYIYCFDNIEMHDISVNTVYRVQQVSIIYSRLPTMHRSRCVA